MIDPSQAIVIAHALVGIWFIAGLVGRWITLGAAARSTDLRDMRTLLALSGRFERIVVTGSVAVLALGILAAIAVGRPFLGPIQGAAVDWLFAALVLYLSLVPLVPLVFLPRGKRFDAAVSRAGENGPVPDEVRQAFHDPVVVAAHAYELTVVLAILVLMLAKPF